MYKKSIHLILFIISFTLILLGKSGDISSVFLVNEFNYRDTTNKYRYTDLFRLSKIYDYEEKCLKNTPDHIMQSPDSADIFIIGDSYLENVIGNDLISGDIQKVLGRKVYNITFTTGGRSANSPIAGIRNINFNRNYKKILILESTERHSFNRALKHYLTLDVTVREKYNWMSDLASKYFTFNDVIYFIEHNVLIYPLICLKNTINFRMFGVIDKNIGAYSKEPRMLFYKEDIEFNSMEKNEKDMILMADNIKTLSDKLYNDYNIILLYVIIPDKYSIYNDYVNGNYSYSGFIPVISKMLDERDVYNVNLYEKFIKHKNDTPDKIIYYVSDTHFNEYGKELFVKYISQKIYEIYDQQNMLIPEENVIKIKDN